mmetsp:Transcript_13484/g.23507  ORF Transcript_13484/g.23507 Transcript_13484/m.23507 type:complete len:227 (+) Transcript_13484:1036-1716(+)
MRQVYRTMIPTTVDRVLYSVRLIVLFLVLVVVVPVHPIARDEAAKIHKFEFVWRFLLETLATRLWLHPRFDIDEGATFHADHLPLRRVVVFWRVTIQSPVVVRPHRLLPRYRRHAVPFVLENCVPGHLRRHPLTFGQHRLDIPWIRPQTVDWVLRAVHTNTLVPVLVVATDESDSSRRLLVRWDEGWKLATGTLVGLALVLVAAADAIENFPLFLVVSRAAERCRA